VPGLKEDIDPLFRDRVPEAAARQLAIVLASSTEFHLATLEDLQLRASSSQSAIRRQTEICTQLVAECAVLGVHPRGLRGNLCTRLQDAMARYLERNPR
jgi:hypothetical protein